MQDLGIKGTDTMVQNLLLRLAGIFIFIGLTLTSVEAGETFTFDSYHDIQKLFEKEGYTEENLKAGVREVPRLYLSQIPTEWRDKYSNEVTVKVKKELFFRLLAPGVLRCNELILEERKQLEAIALQGSKSPEEEKQLLEMALKYGVVDKNSKTITPEQVQELLRRVDIIPASLAMAQGANESGWGTSRFAQAGNALFGQWTWGGRGIASKGKQKGKGDYKVAAFDHPGESIAAYMLNLNSGTAYERMRDARAVLRGKGEAITGLELVNYLDKYSQRGMAYVDDLKKLITHNRLEPVDTAYLKNEEPIDLVPASQ